MSELTVIEFEEAVVAADVKLEVLQHDELSTLFALVRPAAAVVLVLRQLGHGNMGRAILQTTLQHRR